MKHELIKTENYLLVVDDSEIKEGDYHVAIRIVKTNGDKAIAFTDQEQLDAIAEIGGAKKIIAHLPLNNSPILEGVDLLPPLEQEDDVWKHGLEDELNKLPYTKHLDDGQYNDGQLAGFEFGANWGYNKAKEKYKYTEEDLRKAWNAAYIDAMSIDEETYKPLFFEDFIQSLSQPKMPVGFECEVESYTVGEMSKLPLGKRNEKIKTTTNPESQTQWVGKYIYE